MIEFCLEEKSTQIMLELKLSEEEYIYPNTVCIDDDKMFVGDNMGNLYIYSIDYVFNKLKIVELKKLSVVPDVIINDLKYH